MIFMVPPFFLVGASSKDVQVYYADTSCDAHVKSASPDTRFGLEEDMEVSLGLDLHESVIFVKQDLSGLRADDIVLYASISISPKYTGKPTTEDLLVGAYWCSDNSWTEESITWNNAPWSAVNEKTLDTDRKDPQIIDLYFDITTAVQNALASGQVTIVFRPEENGTQYIWSYHGLTAPGMNAHLYVQYVSADATDAINIYGEYSSGFLSDISLWYTWINTGPAQLIYIVAVYPEYGYYFPSVNFVGQHYYTEDGTEVVVGHSLLLYELFNDTNQNGILDADFTAGDVETSYYFALNMSSGFTPQSVTKTAINSTWHYTWSVRYSDVMGFLIYTNGSAPLGGDTAALLTLDYLETGYDYFLEGNSTYLKTSLAFGSVTQFEPIDPQATLNGFSLAALHSTLVLSTAPDTHILVESIEYNSSLPGQSTLPMNIANITGTDATFYNLLFDENYTLFTDPPTEYPAETSACPSTSLHSHVPQKQFDLPLNIFQGFLLAFLPRIANSSINIDLDYRNSGLLYRVNYPHWNGQALLHDPTYITYLGDIPPTFPTSHPPPSELWILIISVIAIFGTVVLVLALTDLRKLRKAH